MKATLLLALLWVVNTLLVVLKRRFHNNNGRQVEEHLRFILFADFADWVRREENRRMAGQTELARETVRLQYIIT